MITRLITAEHGRTSGSLTAMVQPEVFARTGWAVAYLLGFLRSVGITSDPKTRSPTVPEGRMISHGPLATMVTTTPAMISNAARPDNTRSSCWFIG